MFHRVLTVACVALFILTIPVRPLDSSTLAQSAGPNPDKTAPAATQPAKPADDYTEAMRVLGSPAGNPECVWLGRRVVSLLWRDDLETAFRHLDLYDRFGCPGGHIQAAFRCLILHGSSIDPKAPDSLNGRVTACWLDPTNPAPPPPPPAGKTTKR